ncbi:MAG TPA: short chain dehydrogenase [Gammaproteobacteria bacterium]|nr:short chain dehydrogenase [Gammaproteobacteria bacterium]
MVLDDKVVVITGGAQGLGLATAIRLAPKKAHIALIDMNPHQLAEAKDAIESAVTSVSTWVCDVSDEEAVDEVFTEIAKQNGRLDAVVNNAGITRDALLLKVKDGTVEKRMSFNDWQQVVDVNLTGTFLCGRAAATEMVKASNGGCIINISSVSRHGNMGQTNYTATKAGVAAMAVTWAKELARQGIRCVAIAPGYIGTEMVLNMKPEALEKIAAGIPAGRLGQPNEIAQTVEFILENDYINGRVIEIDGGLRV